MRRITAVVNVCKLDEEIKAGCSSAVMGEQDVHCNGAGGFGADLNCLWSGNLEFSCTGSC